MIDNADELQTTRNSVDDGDVTPKTPGWYYQKILVHPDDTNDEPMSIPPEWADPKFAKTLPNAFDPNSVGWNAIAPAGLTAGSYVASQAGQPDQSQPAVRGAR
jgi:hypothetical protein